LRQDPFFLYLTGIEIVVGAVLAIDCDESWLFLPTAPPLPEFGFRSEIQPGVEAEHRLSIDHVVDWSNLKTVLAARSKPTTLYFADGFRTDLELPGDLVDQRSKDAPLWIQVLANRQTSRQKTPAFNSGK
jgi:hypothetical protein